MPKLSVYVPDSLLEAAKQADPDVSPSAVLQNALRGRLLARSARPYATLDDVLERDREAAQRLVIQRVREAWRQGYAVGLAFSEHLPWEAFEELAAVGWNVKSWAEDFDDAEYPMVNPSANEAGLVLVFDPLLQDAMDAATTFPRDADGMPIGVTGEGFLDALRDVWEGARAIQPRSGEALVGGDPGGAIGKSDADPA